MKSSETPNPYSASHLPADDKLDADYEAIRQRRSARCYYVAYHLLLGWYTYWFFFISHTAPPWLYWMSTGFWLFTIAYSVIANARIAVLLCNKYKSH